MNLLQKLALVTLLATANGLSAHSDDNQTRDFVNTFTLSEFANASNQEQIVTELLQNRELSDEKIAQMLEVPVTEVTRARTYFGPLEVAHLAELAANGYKSRCYKQHFFRVCIPTVAAMAVFIPIYLGVAVWFTRPNLLRRALPWLADPDGLQNRYQQLQNDNAILEAKLKKAPKKWFWRLRPAS